MGSLSFKFLQTMNLLNGKYFLVLAFIAGDSGGVTFLPCLLFQGTQGNVCGPIPLYQHTSVRQVGLSSKWLAQDQLAELFEPASLSTSANTLLCFELRLLTWEEGNIGWEAFWLLKTATLFLSIKTSGVAQKRDATLNRH